MSAPRKIIWFSCGAASTIAAMLALKEDRQSQLVYCDTGGEHPDNARFLGDVELWLNTKVTILKSVKYSDHFDVCERTSYINGPSGARCTVELKKTLRFDFQKPDDVQFFGYTFEEKERAARFGRAYPEITARYPLIEQELTKENCLGLLERAGICIPEMYRLGFNNNNCIGCVKGGAGYWNKIRRTFPSHFARMAKIERDVGHSCIKTQFLDELDEGAGRHVEQKINCDFICQSVDIARG